MFINLEKYLMVLFNQQKVDPDTRQVILNMIKSQELNQSTSYDKNYIQPLSQECNIRIVSIFYSFMSKSLITQQTEYLYKKREK